MDEQQEVLMALPVVEFLDRLAARAPAPGGGAAAGVVGALAAALGRMVAAYSVGKKTPDADRAEVDRLAGQLERADAMLRGLVDEDARAYANYARLARDAGDDAASRTELDAASGLALAAPLEICAGAAGVLAILEELAPVTSRYILSDLEASAILAEATVRCAGCTVRASAASMRNASLCGDALESLARIETSAQGRLTAVLAVCKRRIQG